MDILTFFSRVRVTRGLTNSLIIPNHRSSLTSQSRVVRRVVRRTLPCTLTLVVQYGRRVLGVGSHYMITWNPGGPSRFLILVHYGRVEFFRPFTGVISVIRINDPTGKLVGLGRFIFIGL